MGPKNMSMTNIKDLENSRQMARIKKGKERRNKENDESNLFK